MMIEQLLKIWPLGREYALPLGRTRFAGNVLIFFCYAIYLLNLLPLDTNNKCIKSYTN